VRVESLEKWAEVAPKLFVHGCRLFTMQYDADHPEGFHAWFWCPDYPTIEIVTHNKDVQNAIITYKDGR
jgi:hypothetical protein